MSQYEPHKRYDRRLCMETVYVRDTTRFTGRGRGFEAHFNRQQCGRRPEGGRAYCWQHPWGDPGAKMEAERTLANA